MACVSSRIASLPDAADMRNTVLVILLLLVTSCSSSSAAVANQSNTRARPPKWTADVGEVFFEDARKHFQGERPQSPVQGSPRSEPSQTPSKVPANLHWSSFVEPDTLTAEVKRIHYRLGAQLSSAGKFKSGGNAVCRRDLSMLTVLFHVIGEYDQEIRWRELAEQVRVSCSQVAQYCEQPSDESLTMAKGIHERLADLLSGQSKGWPDAGLEVLVDRGQLMLRMELAMEEALSPWLATRKEFRRRKTQVAHESQMLAMLARVICQPQYEYADDESFVELARKMDRASRQLTEASQQGDYEAAREALGRVTQSCGECHEGYRG